MKLIGVASVRGAPGVTTCAHLIAGALSGPTMLVEADLAGGVMAARYGLGREPGLTTLAAAGTPDTERWRDHVQNAGGVAVLVGPDAPDHARSLWDRAGSRLGEALLTADATSVVDLGRLSKDTPLIGQLTVLVVLVRPVVEHLVTFAHVLPALRLEARVVLAVVGSGEYRPADLESTYGVDVLGVIAHDSRAAEILCGTGFGVSIGRSRLARSVGTVAQAIDSATAWVPTATGRTP